MATTGGCHDTQGLLQVLAEGGLNATERAAVEAHVASCPACTAEGARLKDNAGFLQETLAPFRMPADLTPEFLLGLPRKDPRRKAPPPGAAASPRTLVLGDTRPRGTSPWKWIGGIGFLAAAAGLAWLFLSERAAPARKDPAPLPGIGQREPPGKGAADPKPAGRIPRPAPTGTAGSPPALPPAGPVRTAADLVTALRGARGAYTPLIYKGWELLLTSPPEAKAIRDLASLEKEAWLRGCLVACLGADGSEDNRSALRGYLGDEAAEVRSAAALALGRSLSMESPRKLLSSGKPLELAIDVGVMADDPARGELAARLSVEPDVGVRQVLVSVLAATASADAAILARILEGAAGYFGGDLQEPCVRALQGVKDPAIVVAFAEALARPDTPKALHGLLLEGMTGADEKVAAEKLAELLAGAQGADLRREVLGALGRVGGPAAQKAFSDALGGDSDAAVRLLAAASLQRFPSREALDVLQRAAENDGDLAVRQEAERVARGMKAALDGAEGNAQEKPPGGDPPPPPAPDGN